MIIAKIKLAKLKVKSSFGSGTWYPKGTPVQVRSVASDNVYAFCDIEGRKQPAKVVTSFLDVEDEVKSA